MINNDFKINYCFHLKMYLKENTIDYLENIYNEIKCEDLKYKNFSNSECTYNYYIGLIDNYETIDFIPLEKSNYKLTLKITGYIEEFLNEEFKTSLIKHRLLEFIEQYKKDLTENNKYHSISGEDLVPKLINLSYSLFKIRNTEDNKYDI